MIYTSTLSVTPVRQCQYASAYNQVLTPTLAEQTCLIFLSKLSCSWCLLQSQ